MSPGEPANRVFPSTHWSIIESAGREDAQGDRAALSELLSRYCPALRAHLVIRRSVERDQVDDLLQSFISSKMLEADLLACADRTRGRFRTLLLTALDRYVISQQRHDRASKRGAGRTQSLEQNLDAAQQNRDTDLHRRADVFDVEWARQILRQALQRMRQQCEADGRLDTWGIFEARVLRPALEGTAPAAYELIVRRFSVRSPTQLWNAVRTGKLLFARILRSVVAEYAESEDQIEAELADLRAICGRLGPTTQQDGQTAAYP